MRPTGSVRNWPASHRNCEFAWWGRRLRTARHEPDRSSPDPRPQRLAALRHTWLERDAPDVDPPFCAERGIGIVIGGVFNSGILATGACGGARRSFESAGRLSLERVSKIEAVCRSHRVDRPAAALQFPLAHPPPAGATPGARSAALTENFVAGVDQRAPSQLWLELSARGPIRPDAPVPSQRSQIRART